MISLALNASDLNDKSRSNQNDLRAILNDNCCSCDIESYGIESYGYHQDLHVRKNSLNKKDLKETQCGIEKKVIHPNNKNS